MHSGIFPVPAHIRSVIVEDVCGFSVGGLLTKTILNSANIDAHSRILILGTERHPSTPTTQKAWESLLNRTITKHEQLTNDPKFYEILEQSALLEYFFQKIQSFCLELVNEKAVLITNLTPLLLGQPSSKIARLLGM